MNDTITFRRATREDAPAYLALERHTVPGMYATIGDLERIGARIEKDEVFMIEAAGTPIGMTAYRMKAPDHAHLAGLIVDPAFRDRGIARLAAEFRLEKLEGVRRIDLVTHPRNSKIICLYLSLGFVLEAWHDDHFGDGEPRVVIARER